MGGGLCISGERHSVAGYPVAVSSDWIIVGLTFVLVCTTIWYAVTTHRALSLANTANDRWQSEPSESRQVEARLEIVYSDGFRSDLEVFSAPFGLVHLDPPNSLL
jgi:uncharacterized membrane protein